MLLICAGCSTAYAVGAPHCPQCLSTDREEDHPMPKITVHGGATNAAEDEAPADEVPAGDITEEESSPGNSSETSSEKPPTSPKKSGSAVRSRARTTESPS
jgi:hypothetical protein